LHIETAKMTHLYHNQKGGIVRIIKGFYLLKSKIY